MKSLIAPEAVVPLAQIATLMTQKIREHQRLTTGKKVPEILRLEIKIPDMELLSWLHRQIHAQKFYCANRNRELEIAAIGMAERHWDQSSGQVNQVITSLSRKLSHLEDNVRYYGGFAFDTPLEDIWKPLGSYQFFLPRFEIMHTEEGTLFACHMSNEDWRPEKFHQLLKELKELTFEPTALPKDMPVITKRQDFPDKSDWLSKAQELISGFHLGHLEKVVLARQSVLSFQTPLNPWVLMHHLREASSANCFHFCFQPQDGSVFLGASPERLYKRKGRQIQSEAIAGTRPRGETAAEDQRFRQELLNSRKDFAEHQYVVQGIAQSLQSMWTQLEIEEPTLLPLNGGQHLIARLEGTLKESITDRDLLKALPPTPAVAGWPVEASLREIRTHEPFRRGWYAAPVGYLAAQQAEFIVAIRSGLIHDNRLFIYAGAGLVKDSLPQAEWEEIEYKLQGFLNIVQGQMS